MVEKLVIDLDPARAPSGATTVRAPGVDTSEINLTVGASIDKVRQEVDEACAQMETFYQLNPDEIIRLVGGHSARLSTLRVLIMRIEDYQQSRMWKDVRQRDIEPTIEELERQYRNASRLESVRELDWKIESGQS